MRIGARAMALIAVLAGALAKSAVVVGQEAPAQTPAGTAKPAPPPAADFVHQPFLRALQSRRSHRRRLFRRWWHRAIHEPRADRSLDRAAPGPSGHQCGEPRLYPRRRAI